MRAIVSILFKIYFYQIIRGRYISDSNPLLGRFSNRNLKAIYLTISNFKGELLSKNNLSKHKTQGNKLMVYCGILSLATYRGLRLTGLSHQYATLLVSDIVWKLYILGSKILWTFAGLLSRDPQKRLNILLKWLCKYPFNQDPNGYQYDVQVRPDHLEMNFSQCAVHQLMLNTATAEEMDFFSKSWCLYDFSLPAYLIEGGYYEREHTLSHGDQLCDMKWYEKSPVPREKV